MMIACTRGAEASCHTLSANHRQLQAVHIRDLPIFAIFRWYVNSSIELDVNEAYLCVNEPPSSAVAPNRHVHEFEDGF